MPLVQLWIDANRPIGNEYAVEDPSAGTFVTESESARCATGAIGDVALGSRRLNAIARHKELQCAIRPRPFGPLDPNVIGNPGRKTAGSRPRTGPRRRGAGAPV